MCERVHVCISQCLFRESVCLHQSVCQFSEGACFLQSEWQFRGVACLLQPECHSLKKQDVGNSIWWIRVVGLRLGKGKGMRRVSVDMSVQRECMFVSV